MKKSTIGVLFIGLIVILLGLIGVRVLIFNNINQSGENYSTYTNTYSRLGDYYIKFDGNIRTGDIDDIKLTVINNSNENLDKLTKNSFNLSCGNNNINKEDFNVNGNSDNGIYIPHKKYSVDISAKVKSDIPVSIVIETDLDKI